MAEILIRPGVLRASSVTVAHCVHGTVYLSFHDADHVVFATARLPAQAAVDLCTDLTVQCESAIRIALGGSTDAPLH